MTWEWNIVLVFGGADVNWSNVFDASVVQILTPPMLLQHPGMGSKF